jgi:hypothetical protein
MPKNVRNEGDLQKFNGWVDESGGKKFIGAEGRTFRVRRVNVTM